MSYKLIGVVVSIMKSTIIRLLKSRAGWALLIALAGAAGLKLTTEQEQAVKLIGPELATEIESATND